MNRASLFVAAALPALLVASVPATAQTTHYVDARGHCDGRAPCFGTIAAGLAAAGGGDTVAVFGGYYDEALTPDGKAGVTLRTHVDAFTELTCTTNPRPKRASFNHLSFEESDNTGFRVENMIFGGLEVFGPASAAEILGNRIGSITLGVCSLEITHNVIHGSGINVIGASDGCVISDNTFEGGDIDGPLFTTVLDLVVRDNIFKGGSILLDNEVLLDTVVARNRLTGGSIVIGSRTVRRNLVEGNAITGGGGIVLLGEELTDENRVIGNDVRGSTGTGILVNIGTEGSANGTNEISGNTALDNAVCDIEDTSDPDVANVWSDNTFNIACGTADG